MAILEKETEIHTTTLVATTITTKKTEDRNQRKTEVTETAPSCNYCVATIVARPLRTTVTFDQSVKNAISAEFGILAVSLPEWWFL